MKTRGKVLNLGGVPIIGQSEDKDKKIAQLAEMVDLLRNKILMQQQALQQAQHMIMLRIQEVGYLLNKFSNNRIRIDQKEYQKFLEENEYEFYTDFDKQTDQIILGLREPKKLVKKEDGENDKGTEGTKDSK